ncbi:MAG: hypothetical protein M1594_00835 [Candidatus Marsarchaeota archaeon]|nr:hypothetical protein [Candidatus Marsarchaeota archaeon]
MDRAQVSVEFFIIAAFVFALAGALLSVATSQINQNTILDNLAMGRNAIGVVSSYINFVGLSGVGANVSTTVFVPTNMICFIPTISSSNIYCTESNNNSNYNVTGEQLFFPPTINPICNQQGWLNVVVSNNGGVFVNCTQLN